MESGRRRGYSRTCGRVYAPLRFCVSGGLSERRNSPVAESAFAPDEVLRIVIQRDFILFSQSNHLRYPHGVKGDISIGTRLLATQIQDMRVVERTARRFGADRDDVVLNLTHVK